MRNSHVIGDIGRHDVTEMTHEMSGHFGGMGFISLDWSRMLVNRVHAGGINAVSDDAQVLARL